MPINITHLRIHSLPTALSPTFKIEVTIKNQGNQINIFSSEGELYIRGNSGDVYVARLHSNITGEIDIQTNNDIPLSFDCSVSFADLNRIEDIRKGQKLLYKVKVYIICWEMNKPRRYVAEKEEWIEKSAWIEDILGAVGYGKVDYLQLRFTELYKDERIEKELGYFHKAIDAYNEGDYDSVLVECRKVMQGIDSQERTLHISENLGEENYKRAVNAAKSYLSLGAHSETEIKAKVLRNDAEFALLTMLGFLRYVTNILKSKNNR